MNRSRVALILALCAALAAAGWWASRPTPLEKARRALDRGDAGEAVEVVLKRLGKGGVPLAEETALLRELSRGYLMKGAYDNAEKTLRTILETAPDDGYAHLALGFLFFSRGQDAFAADSFRKAKAVDPADPRPCRGLMDLFNFRGDYDLARAEAGEFLKRAPGDPAARRELGDAQRGLGLFADAAQSYEAVLAAAPSDAGARRLWIESLMGAGDHRRAEEALAPLLKESPDDADALTLQAALFAGRAWPEQAEALERRIYEKDPRRLYAGVALARSLAHRRETDAAQEILMDLAPRLPQPEDVPPPPYGSFYEPWDTLALRASLRKLRVEFHRAMAEVYRARYLAPDAERELRLALQVAPKDAGTLRDLTDLKRAGGDPAEWMAAASAAANLFPQHVELLLDKARALLFLKKPQEALTFAQAAATACPGLARARAVLAEAQLALHRRKEAEGSLKEARALDDRDPSVPLAEGRLRAAQGDFKAAAQSFTEALSLEPALAAACAERARALEKLGKKSAAREDRERAMSLEPRVYAERP